MFSSARRSWTISGRRGVRYDEVDDAETPSVVVVVDVDDEAAPARGPRNQAETGCSFAVYESEQDLVGGVEGMARPRLPKGIELYRRRQWCSRCSGT